jgi:hypothetical protein
VFKQTLYTGITTIDTFTAVMGEIMVNNTHIHNPRKIICGDIVGLVLTTLNWRRGTAYLVVQKSKLGTRFLVYFSDKVIHNAASFGTSWENVDKNTIRSGFVDAIQQYNKTSMDPIKFSDEHYLL